MKHSLTGPAVALLLSVTAWHSPAGAVDHCKANIKAADGTVLVSGRNITGALKWCTSAAPGCSNPQNCQPFFNNSTCVTGSAAKNCVFGDVGTLARITPPDTCAVCLQDDGSNSCAAHVRGCIPGNRGLPGSSVRVRRTSPYPVGSTCANAVNVPFDSARWDTNSFWNPAQPTRLTVPTAGRYLVYGHVRMDADPTQQGIILSINLNGAAATSIARANGVVIPASSNGDLNIASIATGYDFQAGDYVELAVCQNASGTVNIGVADEFSPEFGMVKLP
jgi:hypothetical protein